MTKEEAKKLADVLDYLYDNNCYDDSDNIDRLTNSVKNRKYIRAYAEGKPVLILDDRKFWHKLEDIVFNDIPNNQVFDYGVKFKIKEQEDNVPLCKMMPYTFETAVKAKILGKQIVSVIFTTASTITSINHFGIYTNRGSELIDYRDLFTQYVFLDDGTKCGVNQYTYINEK